MSESSTSSAHVPSASAAIMPDAARRGPDHELSQPLIRTKLHRPPLPSDYVRRDRLLDQMDKAMAAPLTLVSAGAGTGKSVMVAAWLEDRGHPCTWLSLDGVDGDLRRFLRYLVAGMESLHPGSLQDTAALLDAPELPPVAVIAAHFTNELDRSTTPQVLVLDDYHLLDPKSSVHELIRGYLKHPPQSWHLILVSRKDPPLALGSLRGAGKINEIRQQDLPFSIAETAGLLSGSVPSGLGEKQIEAIQLRVEGWAAGLRLVGLACRQAPDIDRFIAQLGGNLPDTTAYLMDEVLTTLPAAFSGYLIKTAVLDRFCPALLDAIHPDAEPATTEMDGTRFVELLNHSNLFVVPLDANCEWFRYHHVFQQLLLDQLKQVCSPNEIHALHSNASTWFEQQGCIDEAIKHAVAADDQAAAADIIERHRNEPLSTDRWWVLQDWLDMLGTGVKQMRPALLMSHGWLAFFRLQLDVLSLIVQQFDSLADPGEEPIWRAERNFFAAVLAYWAGNGAECQRCCEAALAASPTGSRMVVGQARIYRALAQHMNGDTQLALRLLESDIKGAEKNSALFVSRLIVAIAFIHLLDGDLEQAYDDACQLGAYAVRADLPYARFWAEILSGISSFYAARFDRAKEHFAFCTENPYGFETRAAADAFVGLALCEQFTGNPQQAAATLQEAAAIIGEFQDAESLGVIESGRARLQLLQGDAKTALRWARIASIEPYAPGMFMWLEVPEITQRRMLIAAGTTAEREKSLDDLVEIRSQLRACNTVNHLIQVAVLQSLALKRLGRSTEAQSTLLECLALAQPGEWIQPFVEAGEPLLGELATSAEAGHSRDFIRCVLTAYDSCATTSKHNKGTSAPHIPDHVGLTDLTNRELDILELLAQRLQNKQIGARLNISTHTVKDHLKHVYQKLEVSNRRDAIAKAMRVGLLKDSRPNT
ncbi:putative transcriptional regulator [gamma proteobacterium NOR5-3]|nr:putative transcriptional regulator [gamma proteobacterium NOR5-3]